MCMALVDACFEDGVTQRILSCNDNAATDMNVRSMTWLESRIHILAPGQGKKVNPPCRLHNYP